MWVLSYKGLPLCYSKFMNACSNESAFDWIKHGRKQQSLRADDPAWTGNTIRHLLPDNFETYAKIYHRLDAHYENIDYPLSDEEIDILKISRCAPLRTLVQRVRMRNEGTRVRWREVADLLGLPFIPGLSDDWFRARLEPGCWPRYIYGPGEGYLEPDEYSEIASLLLSEGYSQECFYRLAEIPYIATDQPLLFKGSLQDVNAIPTQGSWKVPEYWWSSTHEWCVCSDYDLSFTIVGGPRRVISRILSCKLIEAVEVLPDLRIDYFAPMPSA